MEITFEKVETTLFLHFVQSFLFFFNNYLEHKYKILDCENL